MIRSLVTVLGLLVLLPHAHAAEAGSPRETAMLLPVQDRVDDRSTAMLVHRALEIGLSREYDLIDADRLRNALRELRLRDATHADPSQLRVLADGLGATRIFSATLHEAVASDEPQIALSAWACKVGEPQLDWAGFRAASGLDTRRSLGRGVVTDLDVLAAGAAFDLVTEYLSGERRTDREVEADEGGYRAAWISPDRLGVVAVVPFESLSARGRTRISEIVTAIARAELDRIGIAVMHPGTVDLVLRRRGDLELGEMDPVLRSQLRQAGTAEKILTGTVESYDLAAGGTEPNPHVALSARLIDSDTGEVLWISGQDRSGHDGQKTFRRGRTYAPGTLAQHMMRALLAGVIEP